MCIRDSRYPCPELVRLVSIQSPTGIVPEIRAFPGHGICPLVCTTGASANGRDHLIVISVSRPHFRTLDPAVIEGSFAAACISSEYSFKRTHQTMGRFIHKAPSSWRRGKNRLHVSSGIARIEIYKMDRGFVCDSVNVYLSLLRVHHVLMTTSLCRLYQPKVG